MAKINSKKISNDQEYRRRKNQEPVEINLCAFSAAREVCSALETQAKCDSAAFVTNPLKIYLSHTFDC